MHGIVRLGGLSIAAWALWPGEARAEEEPPRYPAALAARPLILPDRALEGTVELVATRLDLDSDLVGRDAALTTHLLAPRVRAGFSTIELEAALGIFLVQQDPEDIGPDEPDRLQDFYIATRLRRSPDSSIGVELAALYITTAAPVLRPALTLQRKSHLSATSAYESALVVGVQRASRGEFNGAGTAFLLESRGRIEAQVTRTVAAEGRLTMRYLDTIGEEQEFFNTSSLGLEVGVGVVVAVTPAFNVVASVDITDTGDVTGKVFTIGAVWRRLR